jgi:hypothetical protein
LLTDLKTSDGFKHDEFYFILTEVVTPAKITRWYISLTPVFSLPGHYNFDAEGQNIENLKQLINDQLAVKGYISKINPRALPVTKDQLKIKNIAGVRSISIKDDKIIVLVNRGADVNEVRNAVKIQILSIVRTVAPTNKDVLRENIKYSGIGKNKTAIITFAFTLSNRLKSQILTKEHIQSLQKLLHLTPSQMKVVKDM